MCNAARAAPPREGFATLPQARAFMARMNAEHGFAAAELERVFRKARHEPKVIRLITPASDPQVRSWARYRARFVEDTRIAGGLRFWADHVPALRAAEQRYGVPASIIVAIIGVETLYGRFTGGFSTVSALATLAFDYPPRAELFERELEQLLLLARESGRDALSFRGSYAGALGIPQFLPSSHRNWATDFDGDGRIDLSTSPGDAIGSVANFLHAHGWQRGGRVALRVTGHGGDLAPLVEAGIVPTLTATQLEAAGIRAAEAVAPDERITLVDLATPGEETEYWLGFQNFYALTRYNRSSFYAMAVHHLALELARARAAP